MNVANDILAEVNFVPLQLHPSLQYILKTKFTPHVPVEFHNLSCVDLTLEKEYLSIIEGQKTLKEIQSSDRKQTAPKESHSRTSSPHGTSPPTNVSCSSTTISFHGRVREGDSLQSTSSTTVSNTSGDGNMIHPNKRNTTDPTMAQPLIPIRRPSSSDIDVDKTFSGSDRMTQGSILNLSEFESALPQLDPWDAPQDDFKELQNVLNTPYSSKLQ